MRASCGVRRRPGAPRGGGRIAALLGFVPGAHERNVALALAYTLLALVAVGLLATALRGF